MASKNCVFTRIIQHKFICPDCNFTSDTRSEKHTSQIRRLHKKKCSSVGRTELPPEPQKLYFDKPKKLEPVGAEPISINVKGLQNYLDVKEEFEARERYRQQALKKGRKGRN